jgi:CDGSH-type Zn-finger protein
MPAINNQVSVTVSKDGPYIVSGAPPLTKQTIVADAQGESVQWREGAAYDSPAKYALCRCGHSRKAPFCDGTHAQIGFDGTETAERTPYSAQATIFDGSVLALLDAKHLCADGRFCDPNGKVWNQVAHTDDPEIRSMFLRQVHLCPAGRLVAFDKAGGGLQRADLVARGHLADISRRFSVRSPQPCNYLPMRRITEQAVLRWQPRFNQIQGGDSLSNQSRLDVSLWHKADITTALTNVRFWG